MQAARATAARTADARAAGRTTAAKRQVCADQAAGSEYEAAPRRPQAPPPRDRGALHPGYPLIAALRTFDHRGTGLIKTGELRSTVAALSANLGAERQTLIDNEVAEMIREAAVGDDALVSYTAFVEEVVARMAARRPGPAAPKRLRI